MKTSTVLLSIIASVLSFDSVARSDGTAPKVVIPEWVDVAALPAFDAEPFPQDKSPAPRADEWKVAPRVRVSRASPSGDDCHAYRVREWMKLFCDRRTAGLRLLAGSTEGIALWVAEPLPKSDANPDPTFTMGRNSELIFPVRPGDRRLFEVLDLQFGEWEGFGTRSSLLIEEQWLAGAKGPEVSVLAR